MPQPRLRAAEWAALLLDPSPMQEHLGDVVGGDPLGWPGYPSARDRAPGAEAARVYEGRVDGRAAMLIAFDFAHLGGSMGAAVGARVAGAFDRARERALPVVTVAATGGSRMQEGMVALSQMAVTTVAARAHANAGLLQIGIASDPTTGGVYASFLSQADLLLAELGAYVGFAGPRVAAALGEGPPPPGANTAEFAHDHGLVDAVVAREDLRTHVAGALAVVAASDPRPVPVVRNGTEPVPTAWEAVESARAADRPRADTYLSHLDPRLQLHGDRAGGTDSGLWAGLTRLHGRPIALVAMQGRKLRPAGYRTACRALSVAERLELPVVTLVDTPGADPAVESEAEGVAQAISSTLTRMLELTVPSVAAVIGEGGSGGAMALAAADRLLIQRTAYFSVIGPAGAAAILHRDPGRASDVAAQLRLRSVDLVELRIADEVLPDDVEATLARIAAILDELTDQPDRSDSRARRWRTAGQAHLGQSGHR